MVVVVGFCACLLMFVLRRILHRGVVHRECKCTFMLCMEKINEFDFTTTTRSMPRRTHTFVANAQNATIEAFQGGVGWSVGDVYDVHVS